MTRFYIIIFSATSAAISGCGDASMFGECSFEILKESPSPSAKVMASLIERNCGATTDFTTALVLHGAREKLSAVNGDDEVLIIQGRRFVEFQWASDMVLQVRYSAGRIFKEDSQWENIEITFNGGNN